MMRLLPRPGHPERLLRASRNSITSRQPIGSHFVPFTIRAASTMVPKVCSRCFCRRPVSVTDIPQLKDPSLLKQNVCYVNGKWVKARSGKTFEVHGMPPDPYAPVPLSDHQTLPLASSSARPPNLTQSTRKRQLPLPPRHSSPSAPRPPASVPSSCANGTT